MPIPEVMSILKQIEEIHSRKNSDYATSGKDFENFERSAELMKWFESENDKTFIWPIATKLARLATLLNNRKNGLGSPKNEPIEDSFLDLVTYGILWWAYYKRVNRILAIDLKTPTLYKCEWCGVEFNYTPHHWTDLTTGVTHSFNSNNCFNSWQEAKIREKLNPLGVK